MNFCASQHSLQRMGTENRKVSATSKGPRAVAGSTSSACLLTPGTWACGLAQKYDVLKWNGVTLGDGGPAPMTGALREGGSLATGIQGGGHAKTGTEMEGGSHRPSDTGAPDAGRGRKEPPGKHSSADTSVSSFWPPEA